ncbi:hypothetical protein H5410_049691, partial [Solanum commersonii]
MIGIKRGRGRSKKYWERSLDKDMVHLELIKDMTLDRRYGGRRLGYKEKLRFSEVKHLLVTWPPSRFYVLG